MDVSNQEKKVGEDEASGQDTTTDFLWKVIGRYDLYANSINSKAALLMAFNTFVVGAVVLSVDALLAQYRANPWAHGIAAFLFSLTALASLFALLKALQAVSPYLRSPRKPMMYHSLLFFGDVAQHQNAQDYLAQLEKVQKSMLRTDLAAQAHALATGLECKFGYLTASVQSLLWVFLPSLALLFVLKVLLLVFA
jgi:hypothetical protein